MTKYDYMWPVLVLGAACATAEASREPEANITSAVASLEDEGAAKPGVSLLPADKDLPADKEEDRALRRGYGPKDMKSHVCATSRDDGTFVGERCPSGIVVFGPYVTAPAGSDVRLRFSISSSVALKVRSDFVSDGAKQFHGALDEQTIPAHEPRTLGYRVHVFDSARAIEARIGISSDVPASFKIANFELSVQ